jgi:hypothetical protein
LERDTEAGGGRHIQTALEWVEVSLSLSHRPQGGTLCFSASCQGPSCHSLQPACGHAHMDCLIWMVPWCYLEKS